MIAAPSHISLVNKTFSLVPLESAIFADRDAVFVVLAFTDDRKVFLIDAGESDEYGAPPFDAPHRREKWLKLAPSSAILVGTHHLPTDENMREDRLCLIGELKKHYNTALAYD